MSSPAITRRLTHPNGLPAGTHFGAVTYQDRRVRVLIRKVNQLGMFGLGKSGLYEPKQESIMAARELNDLLKPGPGRADQIALLLPPDASNDTIMIRTFNGSTPTWIETRSDASYGSLRCGEFGFLHRDPAKPFGKELVWVEREYDATHKPTGRILIARFLVPDIPVVDPNTVRIISLRAANGLGIIPTEKLALRKTGETRTRVEYLVKPTKLRVGDARIKSVMRPSGWSIAVDTEGFALMGYGIGETIHEAHKLADKQYPHARFSRVVGPDDFEDLPDLKLKATGWFGSLGLNHRGVGRRVMGAHLKWCQLSHVAVVAHTASEQQEEDAG